MYINSEQLSKRLEGQATLSVQIGRKEPENKRPSRQHLTKDEKAYVGALAVETSPKEVSAALNVSSTQADNYSKGITKVQSGFDPELKSKVDEIVEANKKSKQDAQDSALDVLMSSLGIVKEKLPNVMKASEAAMIAKNMSSIVREMDSESQDGNKTQVNILIHAPRQRNLDNYTEGAIEV